MKRVALVVFPGVQVMAFAVVSAFEIANQQAGKTVYDVRVLSEAGGPISTSMGMSIGSAAFDDVGFDTLLIAGACVVNEPASPGMIRYLQQGAVRFRRVASLCTGAFILAQAGVLDGRRVTTHWAYARALQTRFPKIRVEEDSIYIHDGAIWTSAGMSAGIDLALAMVEQDLGNDVARNVAKKLVVYHRRTGGQSQFSVLLGLEPKSDRIQTALDFARRNLHAPLSVPQLADLARLSPRQFSRAFHAETGQSPAKAIEKLRVEAARLMMEEGKHPIDVVAQCTGFVDHERMRRAFLRVFGQPPRVIQRNARMVATQDVRGGGAHLV